MEKITKRDYFEAIKMAMETGETPIAPEEIVAFCDKQLAALEHSKDKARERAEKKKAETDTLTECLLDVLTDEYKNVATLIDEVSTCVDPDLEITAGKITSRMTKLIKEGIVEKDEITIEVDGKKKKCMGYKTISDSDEG